MASGTMDDVTRLAIGEMGRRKDADNGGNLVRMRAESEICIKLQKKDEEMDRPACNCGKRTKKTARPT